MSRKLFNLLLSQESGSEGMRLTEAQAINKSLSNLGNVIMALAQKVSEAKKKDKLSIKQRQMKGNQTKSKGTDKKNDTKLIYIYGFFKIFLIVLKCPSWLCLVICQNYKTFFSLLLWILKVWEKNCVR